MQQEHPHEPQRPPIVLVDGRNVQRSRWPNLSSVQLLALVRAWARARDLHAVIVFDGAAPGDLVGEQALGRHATLVGTGREIADDWLARTAAELADADERFWLVTSDRELCRRAGTYAERIVGGGGFLRMLEQDVGDSDTGA